VCREDWKFVRPFAVEIGFSANESVLGTAAIGLDIIEMGFAMVKIDRVVRTEDVPMSMTGVPS
jgi:hypothetical protein